MKKEKVKCANFGQVAPVQAIKPVKEACDGVLKKPAASGHIADTRINSMAHG